MWAEGVAAAAAASGQELEVPKREVRKRGGVLRVRWADASSPSRGFLGTAVGRVSQLCWFAGSESKSDDILGSGLLPRCSPHEGPALGSIDSQPSLSPAPLGGKGSSPSRHPPLGLCPPGLASVFSHKTAMITTANIFSFFFFPIILFICVCAASSVVSLVTVRRGRLLSRCSAGSCCCGFSCCRAQALECGLIGCGTWA